MKRIILSLVILVGVTLTQANAQTALSGGIKTGANMSNFLLNKMDGTESRMKVGAEFGGFMKIEFSENFALQPELLFRYQASDLKDKGTNAKTDFEYWGVELPVYAVGQIKMGTGKGFIGIGPYVGLGFDLKGKPGKIDMYKHDMERFDFGGGALLGYEFNNDIIINAGYQIGFLDLKKNAGEMRSQSISFGVGYKF